MAAIFCHQNPETSIFPLFFNVFFMQYMNCMHFDIIKFIFCAKSFKMAAIYKMAPKMEAFENFGGYLKNGCQSFHQNPEKNTYFSYFSMYLDMQYITLMFLDTGRIYCTENFKMANRLQNGAYNRG